jgi:hypothetical protein
MGNVEGMCNHVTPADDPPLIRPIPQSSDFWAVLRAYYDVRENVFPPGTYPPWYQDDEAFIRAFMKNHTADTGISGDDFYAEFVKNQAVGIRQDADTENGGTSSAMAEDDTTGAMKIDADPEYDKDSVDGEDTNADTGCKKRKRPFQFQGFRGGCALSF